jgi:hypothetical protein
MDKRFMRDQNRNRQMESRLRGRGMGDAGSPSNGGAQSLSEKFSTGILSGFAPGNIGDINRAIWPFAFQFSASDILPGQSIVSSFSVTQEAGFLLRQISHSTFRLSAGNYEYIDPFYFDESTNAPNGLVFTLEDAQSSRNFNGRTPKDIAVLGNANFPSVYPSTLYMLPNQTMLLNLSNTTNQPTINTNETFRSFVTVWGYRIRTDEAQKILSTVTG